MNKMPLVGLILFTVVTTLFIMNRTHDPRTKRLRNLKIYKRKYFPGNTAEHLQYIRNDEKDMAYPIVDRLPMQHVKADGTVDIPKEIEMISDLKNDHSDTREETVGIYKHELEQQRDASSDIGRNENLSKIDNYAEQKTDSADATVRSIGNLDKLWFKWLSDAKLPDSGQMYASVEERLASRRSWMKASCRHMKDAGFAPPNQRMYEEEYTKHFIVNYHTKNRFLFCYLPKVANTNFRRVFLGLQGVIPKKRIPFISGYNVYFVHDDKFTYLRHFDSREQRILLKTYPKFMAVRDPFERLLSGYRNKFFHPNPNQTADYHQKVSSFYATRAHLLKRRDIHVRVDFKNEALRFEEFLVYVVDTYEEGAYLNEHFTASNQLCNPCGTNIDYIAKYDTLYEDVKYIFKRLNIDVTFPGRNDNYYKKETSIIEEAYYKQIPAWLLIKVWNILKYDYVLFGFSLPQWFKEKMNEQ